jgi:hypothetical protein
VSVDEGECAGAGGNEDVGRGGLPSDPESSTGTAEGTDAHTLNHGGSDPSSPNPSSVERGLRGGLRGGAAGGHSNMLTWDDGNTRALVASILAVWKDHLLCEMAARAIKCIVRRTYWILHLGYYVLDTTYWILRIGYYVLMTGEKRAIFNIQR